MPPAINDPIADPQLQAYFDRLDLLAGQALAGEVDEGTFRSEVVRLTLAAALLMFLLGGGVADSPAAAAVMREQTRIARRSAAALADDVFSGRYSAVEDVRTAAEGRAMLRGRLGLWGTTMAGVYARGQVNQPARPVTRIAPGGAATAVIAEPSLVWRLGGTEAHCVDCAGLDGRVLTAGEWRDLGIAPQSADLTCGGWRCDCRLEAVN